MVKRLNKTCSYFPCHNGLEDCTFCYCPFYPCLDKSVGRYIYSQRLGKHIWSCKDCSWIHKKTVVDDIFDSIGGNGRRPRAPGHQLKTGKIGVIILAHGSRLKRANNIVRKIVKIVKGKTVLNIVEPAYLQSCRPDLSKSITKLVGVGCKRIIIVPFFLFAGNHVSRDIPRAIEREKVRYPEVDFVYTKNLDDEKMLGEIVVDRIRETMAGIYD